MIKKLVLASASPRRKQLLEQIGLSFSVSSADIDETPRLGESPTDYVKRLAIEKAMAVYLRLKETLGADIWVLGSDTSVIIDDTILGKPEDKADGIEMLTKLAGREHTVLTSVALVGIDPSMVINQSVVINENKVKFCPLTAAQIEAYWESGEPLGKAGSYAIQGRGAVFVEQLKGSFSGVMGLPLYETAQLLKSKGLFV